MEELGPELGLNYLRQRHKKTFLGDMFAKGVRFSTEYLGANSTSSFDSSYSLPKGLAVKIK